MLTDRLDVPRTPFGRLKHPPLFFWEQTQERIYNLNDKVSRGFTSTLINKNNIFFAIRGHLQPIEVNSRTFYDISALKCIFRADIIAFSAMTFCRILRV